MSYIDTIQNEFVGYFGGNTIHRPLETVVNTDEGDGNFSCCQDDFVIMSGQWGDRGLVVKNPDSAVASFLHAWIELGVKFDKNPQLDENTINKLNNELNNYWDMDKSLNFCKWSLKDYKDFYAHCLSEKMFHPYKEKMADLFNPPLELWVYMNIGELIFFSFPNMAKKVRKDFEKLIQLVKYPVFQNILLLPPGFKTRGEGCMYIDESVLERDVSAWEIKPKKNTPFINSSLRADTVIETQSENNDSSSELCDICSEKIENKDEDSYYQSPIYEIKHLHIKCKQNKENRIRNFHELNKVWANKERICPKCGNKHTSVKNKGQCGKCNYKYYASHPNLGDVRSDEIY